MRCRKEQFFSMYTEYRFRKLIRDFSSRAVYKHWNNWCFRKSGNATYEFEKGYDEDFILRWIQND